MFGLSPAMQGFLGGAAAISVPLFFNLLKEIVFDWKKKKAERAYISVQLVFLLEKFVDCCADVAWDRGYNPFMPEPNDDELEAQTQLPVFDMSSIKGEHKYLSPTMLARLHIIEIKLNQTKECLSDENANWTWGGDNWKYYETRRELIGKVGLYASAIASDLRTEFKIQNTENWEPKKRIIRSIEDLKATRTERDETKRKRKAERNKKI